MHPWHDLSPGIHPPEDINVVIEIPHGSRNKYELDKGTGMYKLDRVLYSSVHYPGDYGLMPQTLSEDGDPLDVLVLLKEATFPGCIVQSRPLGLLRMRDRGEYDEKIIAVASHDPLQREFFDIADLPKHRLKEIEHFFEIYKELEGGDIEIVGWEQGVAGCQEIMISLLRYKEKFPNGIHTEEEALHVR
jgi:inorganic pyrophosphatase